MQGNEKRRIPTSITVTSAQVRNNKISPRKAPQIFQMVQRKVSELQCKLIEIELECLGRTPSIDALMQRLLGGGDSIDFFAFAEEWIEKADIKGKKNYVAFIHSLERFLGHRSLPVDTIDYTLLDDYCRWLKDKPRAQSLYLASFRHLFKEILLRHDGIKNPFDKFKVPRQIPKGQRAMSMEMLLKVFAFHGEGRAQLARDCAVLSFCLMGMNAIDLYNAKIYKDGKICYNRTKTASRRADNAYIEVVVPKEILHLVKKYKGKTTVFDFASRYASYNDFNIALSCGIKKIDSALQFYQFRHTWATIARNDLGIDYYTVGAALNHVHRDDPVTDIYIKRDFTLINEANRKVVEYVFRLIEKPQDNS